jgi:hypothetical protein
MGLRNPWRCWFAAGLPNVDPTSLVCGDVGEHKWEEVNLIAKGKNYGWDVFEGPDCQNTGGCGNLSSQMTFPNFYYPHPNNDAGFNISGGCIIGGKVYTGGSVSSLNGKYIFGDCYGGVWSLDATLTNNQPIVDASYGGILAIRPASSGEPLILLAPNGAYGPSSVGIKRIALA